MNKTQIKAFRVIVQFFLIICEYLLMIKNHDALLKDFWKSYSYTQEFLEEIDPNKETVLEAEK